jgi:hypothetical protein
MTAQFELLSAFPLGSQLLSDSADGDLFTWLMGLLQPRRDGSKDA